MHYFNITIDLIWEDGFVLSEKCVCVLSYDLVQNGLGIHSHMGKFVVAPDDSISNQHKLRISFCRSENFNFRICLAVKLIKK